MINIEHLKKSFGKLDVLKDISLTISPGRATAIVGPNGSGKTTLIKSVLGLVKPDSGRITVKDHMVNGDFNYRKDIGYMPQIASFPDNLTVREAIDMIVDLRGQKSGLDTELYDLFDLEREKDKALRNLSGGTRQKVSATIAFLFNPDIIILDEPTAGLDPVASSRLKDKIHAEKARGKTIILTSHIMSELEELADHVIFLLEGRIIFDGDIDDLIAQTGRHNLERAIAHLMEENPNGNQTQNHQISTARRDSQQMDDHLRTLLSGANGRPVSLRR